jgi:hypothetical protein
MIKNVLYRIYEQPCLFFICTLSTLTLWYLILPEHNIKSKSYFVYRITKFICIKTFLKLNPKLSLWYEGVSLGREQVPIFWTELRFHALYSLQQNNFLTLEKENAVFTVVFYWFHGKTSLKPWSHIRSTNFWNFEEITWSKLFVKYVEIQPHKTN